MEQTLRATLLANLPIYLNGLQPALAVSLVSSVSSPELVQTFWSNIDSAELEQSARFALVEQCLRDTSSSLLTDGSLDTIALEATQTALASSTGTGRNVARNAITHSSALSVDARNTILALICTAIHDQVDDLLSGSDIEVSTAALEIFAAHAQQAGGQVVESDIHLDALVAVHHLTHLLPRESMEEFAVPPAAAEIWAGIGKLEEKEKGVVQDRVDTALAIMLGQTTCRIQYVLLKLVLAVYTASTPTDRESRIEKKLTLQACCSRRCGTFLRIACHSG